MKYNKRKYLLYITVFIMIISLYSCNQMNNELLPLRKDIKTGKLENGMTYYIKSNHKPKNTAELSLVVNAGSVLEDKDQMGFAHFCEHMSFNGTKNFPDKKMIEYFESIGVKFGRDINAYTSYDETVYKISIPLDKEEYLDKGLLALHDWASATTNNDKEINAERGVIHAEFRTRYDAEGRIMNQGFPFLLYRSTYAERPVIGTYEIIDYGSPNALRRFRKDWYRPDLQSIIIVGDFNAVQIETKLKALFSRIPKQQNPREKQEIEIPDHKETIIGKCKDEEYNKRVVSVYYKHPFKVVSTVGDYRDQLIKELYAGMLTKRLYELANNDEVKVSFFSAYSNYQQIVGEKTMFFLSAVSKEGEINESLASILRENERALRYGFTNSEFERIKKTLVNQYAKSFREKSFKESDEYVNECINHFTLTQEPLLDEKYEFELLKKLLEDISLDEIQETGKKLTSEENRVVIINAPQKDSLPDDNTIRNIIRDVKNEQIKAYKEETLIKELLSKEPQAGKITNTKKIESVEGLEKWELSNGAKVLIKPTNYKNDQIYFACYSPGGYSLYQDKDYISASLAGEIIPYVGIGNLSPNQLNKFLSGKMVQFRLGLSDYYESMGGNSTVEDFETLLQLSYLYFTSPRENENRYSSLIEKINLQLKNKYLNPSAIWSDTITSIMTSYHPRFKPITTDRINAELNYNTVYEIYRQRFENAGDFTFFIVGNVNTEKIKPLIEKYIGGLPGNPTKKEQWVDRKITPPKGKINHYLYASKEQRSVVRMLFSCKKEFNLKNKLTAQIMGDALSHALMENIREKMGGVYSINATPHFSPSPSDKLQVFIQFVCDPKRVEELKNEIKSEIKQLKQKGTTSDYLASIKTQIKKDEEISRQSNDYWMKYIQEQLMYNQDFEENNDFFAILNSISNEDIISLSNTAFDLNEVKIFNLMPEKEINRHFQE